MPRASTKVFNKRRGVFYKGRCTKINDGCVESNSTVPKNSADEKNCANGVDTGKVIDVEVFSKHCICRTKPTIFKIVREILKAIAREGHATSHMGNFLHKLSTDVKPQHGFCPSDTDTWCKFKKAELLGEAYHHKNSLPVDVVEALRPVFRDLANLELLKKCLHGGLRRARIIVCRNIYIPQSNLTGDGIVDTVQDDVAKVVQFDRRLVPVNFQARTPCVLGGYLVASGIEPRPSGLESDALTTRLPTALNVCKSKIPVGNGSTLNIPPAASSLLRLWDEGWKTLTTLLYVIPQNWRRTESKHTVACSQCSKSQLTTDVQRSFFLKIANNKGQE
ncbi:uncharacterized protein TNCV_1426281 [Trichonephila clavipes]|nr:uncharacterized protein TNCV_1426281 [Trichonephila clavipes]